VKEIAAARAAGIVEAPVDADEQLIAGNPTLRATDGILGMLVELARKRRKAAAEQST
jgi:hypothetical protein